MRNRSTRKLAFAGLFIALGIVLPFMTGKIGPLGRAFLPMHIPVLITGFVIGAPYGMAVGFITPLLNSLLTGMPPLYPSAITMSLELATYGLVTGLLYKYFPKKDIYIYPALIIAMLAGRIVWGITSVILLGIEGGSFTWQAFIAGGFVNALPGIVIQIVIIPIIITTLKRAGYMSFDK